MPHPRLQHHIPKDLLVSFQTAYHLYPLNKNTQADGLHQLSRDYLSYLWSLPAQELAAKNYFRPTDKKIIAKTTALFPEVNQFDVNQRFGSWDEINTKHFVDNGLFDRLYISAQRADKVNK